MIGVGTLAIFLVAVLFQQAMDQAFLGGYDFWVALGVATALAAAFYSTRRPRGTQTSYYQPVRIRKLRQQFLSGEVTGIVLGFTSGPYLQRFRDANPTLLVG